MTLVSGKGSMFERLGIVREVRKPEIPDRTQGVRGNTLGKSVVITFT